MPLVPSPKSKMRCHGVRVPSWAAEPAQFTHASKVASCSSRSRPCGRTTYWASPPIAPTSVRVPCPVSAAFTTDPWAAPIESSTVAPTPSKLYRWTRPAHSTVPGEHESIPTSTFGEHAASSTMQAVGAPAARMEGHASMGSKRRAQAEVREQRWAVEHGGVGAGDADLRRRPDEHRVCLGDGGEPRAEGHGHPE